jgi:hypothetical protein
MPTERKIDKSQWHSKIKLSVHFKRNAVLCMGSTNGSDATAIQNSEGISCVPANTQTHCCFLSHVLTRQIKRKSLLTRPEYFSNLNLTAINISRYICTLASLCHGSRRILLFRADKKTLRKGRYQRLQAGLELKY